MTAILPQQPSLTAWHWLNSDGRLSHTGAKVEVGQTIRVEPPLSLCSHGLHFSRRAIDSLRYAPGPIVCRVRIDGQWIEEEDKGCTTERTCLAMADATKTLHAFAVWCARQALEAERKAGREPDPRSWRVLEVKAKWIIGEVTDEDLDAARLAAEAAAGLAAGLAAEAAAGLAAGLAARLAAGSAARSAAGSAARSAAGSAQNTELEYRLLTLLGLPVPEETIV